MKFVKQDILDYTSAEITESTPAWSGATLTAGAFVIGHTYTIVSLGTTNFVLIGAATNTIGLLFTATGVGLGTGTAQRTYNVNDLVLQGNYIWKNSFTANTNNEPIEASNKWVKWAVSNKYSLIDLRSSTLTTSTTDCTVVFDRKRIDTLLLGNFSATSVVIENISADGLTVFNTQTFAQSPNQDVNDYYTYIYSAYNLETDKGIFFNIQPFGDKIRIKFTKGGLARVTVGFMVGGVGVDMGKTLQGVKLGFTSYSRTEMDSFGIIKITKRSAQDVIDFETMVQSDKLMNIRRKAKDYRDEIVGFVVDEEVSSKYENIVTLGVLQDIQPVATNFDKTTITWSILESI